MLPQVTQDILREQKSAKNYRTLETLTDVVSEENYNASHLAKMGILNRQSTLYKSKCADASFYPFSVVLEDGRLELIATSPETLETWLVGLNYFAKHKSKVPTLRKALVRSDPILI